VEITGFLTAPLRTQSAAIFFLESVEYLNADLALGDYYPQLRHDDWRSRPQQHQNTNS
jgi:hypothetical protein